MEPPGDGNLTVVFQTYECTGVGFDGSVTHIREARGEKRVETTEHISENPALQQVFGGWVWDKILDPRRGAA